MANDDWVQDVKRWCIASTAAKAAASAPAHQTEPVPLVDGVAYPTPSRSMAIDCAARERATLQR